MHLSQGTLSTSVTALTSVVAFTAFGAACYGARREVSKEKLPALLGLSAFAFLAQMVNCSMGLGFSGHLVGGALLAVLFGPCSAMLSMGVILFVQAVILGDGSLATLGANFLTMGVVSVWGAHFLFRALQGRRKIQADRAQVLAMAVAAYASIVAAAASLALILGGQLSSLLYTHSIIGLLEAAVSVAVFALCASPAHEARPAAASMSSVSSVASGISLKPIAIFCLLALSFVPFSSQLPDGLEYVLDSTLAVIE